MLRLLDDIRAARGLQAAHPELRIARRGPHRATAAGAFGQATRRKPDWQRAHRLPNDDTHRRIRPIAPRATRPDAMRWLNASSNNIGGIDDDLPTPPRTKVRRVPRAARSASTAGG